MQEPVDRCRYKQTHMMTSGARTRVLSIFKKLHRTAQTVFEGDVEAIQVSGTKINEEFRNNKMETNEEKIKELIETAEGAEKYLKHCVVQGVYNPETGAYRMKITKDTTMLDNKLYDPNAEPPVRPRRRKKCSDDAEKT